MFEMEGTLGISSKSLIVMMRDKRVPETYLSNVP